MLIYLCLTSRILIPERKATESLKLVLIFAGRRTNVSTIEANAKLESNNAVNIFVLFGKTCT